MIDIGKKESYFYFLDDLRKTGITNMYGAAPYLRKEFSGLSEKQSVDILSEWMRTFNERHL